MLRRRLAAVGQVLWRIYNLPVCALAFLWRALMFRTTFVAITGSVGKTTAKECLSQILSSVAPAVATIGSSNGRAGIPRTILRTRPWHRFCVLEAGTDRRGNLFRSSLQIRPDVAVILSVAANHTNELRSLEEIALEKARLLRFLRPKGTAILNGDDPRVAAMAQATSRRVVKFGSSPESDVQAREARAEWPSRLRFHVTAGGVSCEVRTQLVGAHWVPSVTGAIAAALACGVSLEDAAKAVESVQPFTGRMQPVTLPSGAVMLRDEFNGSYHTTLAAMNVMRSAQARRRVIVFSDCSDLKKKPRERLQLLARTFAQFAGLVVFVGDRADYGVRYAVAAGMKADQAHGFMSLNEAAAFLRSELGQGDLVLLKGRGSDHLSRVYFGLFGSVSCQKLTCHLRILCDLCPELQAVPDLPASLGSRDTAVEAAGIQLQPAGQLGTKDDTRAN